MAAGNVKYGNLIENHEALPGHAEISTMQIYTHVTCGQLLGIVHSLENGLDDAVTKWSLTDEKKKQ